MPGISANVDEVISPPLEAVGGRAKVPPTSPLRPDEARPIRRLSKLQLDGDLGLEVVTLRALKKSLWTSMLWHLLWARSCHVSACKIMTLHVAILDVFGLSRTSSGCVQTVAEVVGTSLSETALADVVFVNQTSLQTGSFRGTNLSLVQ